ncbi:MAG: AAA family ATPase [Fusobacteriaceae bacterium]
MRVICFILFLLFIEKKIALNTILQLGQNTVGIQTKISILSGVSILIVLYLYVKYRSNIKDLVKVIFYFLVIFIAYPYKGLGEFYRINYLFLNNKLFILFILIVFSPYICAKLLNCNSEKNLLKNSLYSSRKNKIELLKQFLNVYDDFSITGEWGIGKSFLLKYFFENSDKKKYEEIIIDISSYSTNHEILKKIDSEINKIFKKYHFFRFSPSIFKEVNVESSFIETLKKMILSSMNDNLNSCIESLPITIVLCLDNIERINDLNRITLLFASIDEQLINKISNRKKLKVIYLYDKGHMVKIFNKENISFNSYISKYSESSIQLYGIEEKDFKDDTKYSKIIEVKNEITRDIENRSEGFIQAWTLQIETLFENTNGINHDQKSNWSSEKLETLNKIKSENKPLENEILNKINNYIKQIEEKLKNPRFIEQCFKLETNTEQKLEIKNIIKYKIILDIFQNVNLTSKSVTEIYIITQIEKIQILNQISLSSEDIELICIQFILFDNKNNLFKNFIIELNGSGLI